MIWKDFYEKLDSGTLPAVLLFAGPEAYVRQEALNALEKKLLSPDFVQLNKMILEGVNAQTIIETAQTLPFMDAKRLLVVRDWAPLLPGKSKDEEPEAEKMLVFLQNPPDTCQIVFFMRQEPDGRKKLPAFFKKQGYEVRFDPLTDAEIAKWTRGQLKPAGKKIESDAMERLVYLAGRDLTRLSGEIEKLIGYTGENAVITAKDVEAVVTKSAEAGVFEMIDFLFAGNAAEAHRTLRTLLQTGENRVHLIGLITRQLRLLTALAGANASGEGFDAAEKRLKLHPYAAKRMRAQLRKLDPARLQAAYLSTIEADFAIKSGKMRDSAALEKILLEISDISR